MKRALEANAKIHGVVKSLSLMKKSHTCSYLNGHFCDGKANVRLFGFDFGMGQVPSLSRRM